MTDLITVNYDNEQPTVSGRELHEALKIKTKYTDWFQRMCAYGFVEGKDFYSTLSKRADGLTGKPRTDHAVTLPMAKELCMIQRTDLGKQFRKYFLKAEEEWNDPEILMARALQYANANFERIMQENRLLVEDEALVAQQNSEITPKASCLDDALANKAPVPITKIAKEYGLSAEDMNAFLAEKGVHAKQGDAWVLCPDYADKGYTMSRTLAYGTEGRRKLLPYWTQKGRLFIYELMKQEGNLPIVEQEDIHGD